MWIQAGAGLNPQFFHRHYPACADNPGNSG